MNIITLKRFAMTDKGTFGNMLDEQGYPVCSTVERPWKNNEKGVSCIPPGEYQCKTRQSERFKRTLYEVLGVLNRDYILIHAGNTAMDVEGCILVGLGWVNMLNWPAVTQSKVTLEAFMNRLMGQEFKLIITNV